MDQAAISWVDDGLLPRARWFFVSEERCKRELRTSGIFGVAGLSLGLGKSHIAFGSDPLLMCATGV